MARILIVLAVVMLVSTLICGLWIKFSGKADASSVNFHMWPAIATTIVVLIALFIKR
ncbi:MAG TPA: hypothetical protein VGK02_05925 [Candidatus Aquicultor sp.]|jgi:ABC-type Na+ efflux pump permease subunit